jgi:hypothetical protein
MMTRGWVLGLLVVAACGGDGATGSYSTSMERFTKVSKEHLGGQIEVHFVAAGEDSVIREAASDCVDHYLDTGSYVSAWCYGFPSEADFEHADSQADGGMKHLCWVAREGQAINGSRDGETGNDVAAFDGCPGR